MNKRQAEASLVRRAKTVFDNKRRVLTRDERRVLTKVKTTRSQALDILRRNLGLLTALYDDSPVYTGYVGCPHCDGVDGCSDSFSPKCAWAKAVPGASPVFACCRVTFGGVRYGQVNNVIMYSDGFEELNKHNINNMVTWRKVETFLLGHVEWALDVLTRRKAR